MLRSLIGVPTASGGAPLFIDEDDRRRPWHGRNATPCVLPLREWGGDSAPRQGRWELRDVFAQEPALFSFFFEKALFSFSRN